MSTQHTPADAFDFDRRYHAKNSGNKAKWQTINPCAICGWAKRMAIHDEGNRNRPNIGHAYQPGDGIPYGTLRSRERRSKGLCSQCYQAATHGSMCEKHAEANRERSRQRAALRKAQPEKV